MSEAHIPQPNTQSSAPAEAFDSTADAPHGPTVAGIGVPAGPPQEVSPHTGASNTFDITIHRQFIPIDTISWSVAQVKGTLIWYVPVHPSRANPILAYLNAMYNAWGGSMEYNFKIAGTGFHAGAVAIVRIPPNRHPSEFSTPASWGPFEYVVLDPKMLEVASMDVSDQRPIAYHYNPFNQKDSYSFGGYLAMYVLIPLNTSSTGSQQIAIQVFNRPGMTFQFSQLITPYKESPTINIPSEINTYLDFNVYDSLANAPVYCTKLYIRPDTLKQTDRVSNCFTLKGANLSLWFSKYASLPSSPSHVKEVGYKGKTTSTSPFKFEVNSDDTQIWQMLPKNKVLIANLDKVAVMTGNWSATDNKVFRTVTFVSDQNLPAELQDPTYFAVYEPKLSTWFENNVSAKAANESFLMFGEDVGGLSCIQTDRIAQAAFLKIFAELVTEDQCLLFVLKDKTENLNVGYVKLYAEGFFTARSSKDEIVYDIQNMQLIFDSFILRTDPIPFNATYSLNALAISQKYSLSRLSSAQKGSR